MTVPSILPTLLTQESIYLEKQEDQKYKTRQNQTKPIKGYNQTLLPVTGFSYAGQLN